VLLAGGVSLPLGAQTLPSEPIALAGGRLTIGGDVSATFSCASGAAPGSCGDDGGFYNYTDYRHSALRMLRIDVNAALAAGEHVSVLGEVRSDNGEMPEPYALYLRLRPWADRNLDLQIGRIPPTFGAFARRMYPADNLLIGYPLAYQYLTSLRSDALPATEDELLRMRGRGWLSSFSIGNAAPDNGLPLVSAFRWDTGIQFHAANPYVDAAISVTTGTIARPLVGDDNAGKQVAGRAAFHLGPSVTIGVSGARGPFVSSAATDQAGFAEGNGRFTQTAWGADVEYSRAYYLLRFETIVSDWQLPLLDDSLRAVSLSAEGRYKLRPGLYAAARVDRLDFSRLAGSAGIDEWDAPVTRLEVGGGYSLQRNLVLKLAFQHNRRDGGREHLVNIGAVQALFWF
jgi:hypothetical protein